MSGSESYVARSNYERATLWIITLNLSRSGLGGRKKGEQADGTQRSREEGRF